MSNIPNPHLLKDLNPFNQAFVQSFHKLQPAITCNNSKCSAPGTITHITNSNPSTPIFECTLCHLEVPRQHIDEELKHALLRPPKDGGRISKLFTLPEGISTPPTPITTNNVPLKANGIINFGNTTSFSGTQPPVVAATNITKKNQPATSNNKKQSGKRPRRLSDDQGAAESALTKLQQLVTQLQVRLAKLEMENNSIKQQLDEAVDKNHALEFTILDYENKIATQQQPTSKNTEKEDVNMDDEFPPLETQSSINTTTQSTKGAALSKWATVASSSNNANSPINSPSKYPKNKNKKSNKNKNNKKTSTTNNTPSPKKAVVPQYQLTSAIRAFSTPASASPQAYSYIYYPSKSRISRAVQRKNLRALGAANGRILDIHYPARNVVALLVHDDYKQELIDILLKSKVTNLENYDPTNHTSITDPKYAGSSIEEKSAIASKKHNERLVRALPFIRHHISRSVAAFFLKNNAISQPQHDNFIEQWTKAKESRTTPPSNSSNNTTNNNTNSSNSAPTNTIINTNNTQEEQSQTNNMQIDL